jgi:hypothetical protein
MWWSMLRQLRIGREITTIQQYTKLLLAIIPAEDRSSVLILFAFEYVVVGLEVRGGGRDHAAYAPIRRLPCQ